MNTIRHEFRDDLSIIKKHIVMLDGSQRMTSSSITADDIRLMKASVYLQLYNLMESNVSKLLNHIHDTIDSDTIIFKDLSKEMQLVLFSHLSGLINEKNVEKSFLLITNNHQYARFGRYNKSNYKGYRLSGNIDHEVIRDLFLGIGIKLKLHPKYKLLKTIKDHRNWLAHGNKTFIEIGQNTIPRDLEAYVNAVDGLYRYLFRKIEEFCDNKRYLKVVP